MGAAVGDGQAGDLGGGRTSAGKDAELLCNVRHAGLQGEGNSRGRGYVQSCRKLNLCNTLPSLYNQEHALTTYIVCFASHYYMYMYVKVAG